MMTVVENFSNVPKSKPTNVPNAALKAWLESDPCSTSPTNAPSNGKINNPNGGKINNPITTPSRTPIIPYLLPPHFLAPSAGIK